MKTDKEIIEEVLREDKNGNPIWKHHSRDAVEELIQKALNLSKANYKKQVEDLIDEVFNKELEEPKDEEPFSKETLGEIKVLKFLLKQKLGEIK